MQANIIHNPARIDRMVNIQRQMSEQNIENYRIWPAVMDDNPVRGCVLAHKQIVQWAKDEGLPAVWILEDDVMFTASGAADRFVSVRPNFYRVYTAGVYGTHKFWYKGSVYEYPKSMSGTHCYIVKQEFYDRFLQLPADEHLDVSISKECLGDEHNCELVLAKPMCALQQPGYSDILKQQVDYNNEKYLWQYELFKG